MEEIKRPYRIKDMSGQRFGRLTVIESDGYFYNKSGRPYAIAWKCRCDCGNVVRHSRSNLLSGEIKSCGCYIKENRSNFPSTHGLSKTKIYYIYIEMVKRCFSKTSKAYGYYGGRGITICPEWLGEHGFENFAKWSFENGYEDGLSIERKDVNGNYCPENCYWITMEKQAQNKTNSVIAIETGRSLSYENSIVGIVSEHIAMTRYAKYGWDLYDATHIPQLKQGIHYKKWIERHPEYLKEKERGKEMNLEAVTLQDCLDNYNFKGQCAILNDGKIIGFQQEEIPTQTANPSGDK